MRKIRRVINDSVGVCGLFSLFWGMTDWDLLEVIFATGLFGIFLISAEELIPDYVRMFYRRLRIGAKQARIRKEKSADIQNRIRRSKFRDCKLSKPQEQDEDMYFEMNIPEGSS